MASGGVSRSGRVRKKSAKLMEMEDWDSLDLNEGPSKAKKRPKLDDVDYEAERKVAPIKIPKAATVATKSMPSPVKRRGMEDMIHLKNLQNIQESGYLNVPTVPKPTVQTTQHPQAMYTASAMNDDSSSSSSESSETSSEEDSDSDDSVPYARPIQRVPVQQKAVKKTPYHHALPQPKATAIEYDADHHMKHVTAAVRRPPHPASPLRHHVPPGLDGGGDTINVEESDDEDDDDDDDEDDEDDDDDDDDTRDSHLVIAEEQPSKQKPKKRGPPARGVTGRARKANDDPEYEEPGRKLAKKPAPAKTAKKPAKEKAKSRPMTAYMLWCQERRKSLVAENPGLDFATISKKLGEAWQMLPDKEKIAWKRKAKVPTSKGSTLISTGRPGTTAPGGPRGTPKAAVPVPQEDPRASPDGPRSLGTGPIDVAAHLKLLGESLSTIGRRLTEHEGQIAVSGSLSVLLDSTLCALGPLLCLTSVSREMDGCSKETLTKILNNVAYVMPGL